MSLLTIGVRPHDYELAGLDESDLVICIGYDFVEYDPRTWNPRGDRRIVHIDSLPAEISAHYVPDVEVVGEIREALRVLRERVRKPRDAEGATRIRESILKHLASELAIRSTKGLKPQRILWQLRDILDPDDLLISDVGAHKLWLGRFFRALKPNTVLISNGLSAMGIALPGGSAATLNLIFRDGGLGSIKWKQAAKFGRTTGTEFGNPDFLAVAKAFGVRGVRVDRASELEAIMEDALEAKVATVVDIPVDYSDNPFLAAGR